MTRVISRGVLFAVAVISAFLPSPPAQAGTATIYQCRGPAGQLAGTEMLHAPAPNGVSANVTCGASWLDWPIEFMRSPGNTADRVELVVTGPAQTAISGGELQRQMFGYVYSLGNPQTWGFGYRLMRADGTVIERCGTAYPFNSEPQTCAATTSGFWQFPTPTVAIPAGQTPALRVAYGCFNTYVCAQSSADEKLLLRQLRLRVDDLAAPVVGGAVGSLVSEPVVRSRSLSVNASDAGLGLYRLIVAVDGRPGEAQPFDSTAADCADLDQTNADPYEFSSTLVCPTPSTSRTFFLSSLPTTGQHQVRVDVEDASGNRTPVLDRVASFDLPAVGLRCPAGVCVHAPPQPNGVNASPTAKLTIAGKHTITLAHGRRASVSGRLVNSSGAAIAGAQLEVSELEAGSTTWRSAGQVRTDDAGQFRYSPLAGASRTVGFQYRPVLGNAPVSARAQISLRTHAGVTLVLRPSTVNPGGVVRVRGRLLGAGKISGLYVELQARDGREWRTFKTLPVRRGRFVYRYRFRHTTSGVQFLWRIYAREQRGLPYSGGSSRAAWVSVRS